MIARISTCLSLLLLMAACAVPNAPAVKQEGSSSQDAQIKAQKALPLPPVKRLKRKVAVGRFTNETRYGRSLLRDYQGDPLGKQALDILSAQLVATGRFLVFERPDLNRIESEQRIAGSSNLVGVDALILGSITEFGRSTTGQSGFLSSTKKQLARAKVDIRLADVHNGLLFFSTTGSGEATTEAGEVAGFGSRAGYDATLNDKALTAAISETVNQLVTKLEARPWRTAILKVSGNDVYISGGSRQGLRVGDELALMVEGERMKSPQTGLEITLPGREIGRLRVVSFFGTDETNEGSLTRMVQGALGKTRLSQIYVAEPSQ